MPRLLRKGKEYAERMKRRKVNVKDPGHRGKPRAFLLPGTFVTFRSVDIFTPPYIMKGKTNAAPYPGLHALPCRNVPRETVVMLMGSGGKMWCEKGESERGGENGEKN